MSIKEVHSEAHPLKILFSEKFTVDYYQRDYVWQRKHIEDLINDLTSEFLKNWKKDHSLEKVSTYDPYFMGEIVLSTQKTPNEIIDGQQRITSLSLLLIYLIRMYSNLPFFPKEIEQLVYSNSFGTKKFNLEIKSRNECMKSLLENGTYELKSSDDPSVHNIVARYNDIEECWNNKINETNAVAFTYWIMEKVMFSKVWTNSDDFAYVIFETMNDRGLSLTQVEMLRSYLLSKITDHELREKAMNRFDLIVRKLVCIKLSSKSKSESDFFRTYFRTHLAEDLSQSKNAQSDFVRIGKEFHRWLRDNEKKLNLLNSDDFLKLLDKLEYYSVQYEKIYKLIESRNAKEFLYLIVNSDYNFTMQPALILASIAYGDNDEIVNSKIQIVSKYLTKVLTWRTWNHWMISQSSLEASIYQLCKQIRGKSIEDLTSILKNEPIELPQLKNGPILNQQIKSRIKVLLALITEIVAFNSGESDYILNKSDVEVEHIWCDHPEMYVGEVEEKDFSNLRNTIGDLLVLPKSFNASYGDDSYEIKVVHYIEQNILAQSLNANKYRNNPGFIKFINDSGLNFKAYSSFKKNDIGERTDLYRSILLWNWNQ